jgi:3-hydroxyisobutyrate dehydrogenase-like beta-hydroxyacid dehydrogenase
MSESVGLLGVGSIGQHYCSNLLRAFGDVMVYDEDRGRLDIATEQGATAAETPQELGERCEFVVASLPDPAAVLQAMTGESGLISAMRPGSTIIDTSTVSPEVNRELYALAIRRDVGYLDAPVSGAEPMEAGAEGAKAASLTFMIGGDPEVFARAKPILRAIGKHYVFLGGPGSGTTVKLISNLCSGVYLLVAAEAFSLGAAYGFTVQQLIEVFQLTDAKSYIMTDYLVPRLLKADVTPGFTVDLQVKDHRLAEQLGHESAVPLPFNALAIQTWERLRAAGRGGNDITDSSIFIAEQANQHIEGTSRQPAEEDVS